jgi:hypothetical protein
VFKDAKEGQAVKLSVSATTFIPKDAKMGIPGMNPLPSKTRIDQKEVG